MRFAPNAATGTTNVEIRKSKLTPLNVIAAVVGLAILVLLIVFLVSKH
ncbi:MAG: hypothetical protein ABJA66_12100 [Actinomycetota bacterium]